MVLVIPFETFCKLWTTGGGDTLFCNRFSLVSEFAYKVLDLFRLLLLIKLSREMFTHEISNRMVCVNVSTPDRLINTIISNFFEERKTSFLLIIILS